MIYETSIPYDEKKKHLLYKDKKKHLLYNDSWRHLCELRRDDLLSRCRLYHDDPNPSRRVGFETLLVLFD